MKIYFVASISGKQKLLKEYQFIVECLKELGHNITENTLEPTVNYVYGLSEEDKSAYYKQMIGLIQGSDLVIAEVSHPSLGVGHEISVALEKGKPVVALHNGTGSAHLFEGMQSDKMIVIDYTLANLKAMLSDAIDFAKDQIDTRFNFFIAPRHAQYLDWISKHKKIPRSAYLRSLIKKDIQDNTEYTGQYVAEAAKTT